MRRGLFGFAFVMVVGSAAYAQSVPKPAESAGAAGRQNAGASVTVEGCVMKEVDVPGRRPPENLRAQTEADDDYVLTNTKVISGTAPSPSAKSPSDSAMTGTSGAAPAALMYDIEGIAKDQLKMHVGKRVQIDGVFDHLDNAKLPVAFATDLVEIKGSALRSVPGPCPTK
jgi:hypothetical protein